METLPYLLTTISTLFIGFAVGYKIIILTNGRTVAWDHLFFSLGTLVYAGVLAINPEKSMFTFFVVVIISGHSMLNFIKTKKILDQKKTNKSQQED